MSTKDNMRTEFEQLFMAKWNCISKPECVGERYARDDWECAWQGYQAALNSQAKSAPIERVDNLRKALMLCGISGLEDSQEQMQARFNKHIDALLNHIINRAAPQPPQEDRVRELDALEKLAEQFEGGVFDRMNPYDNALHYCAERVRNVIAAMKEPNTLEGGE